MEITAFLKDSRKFITTFATSPASKSTPHIYISCLALWPLNSPISDVERPQFEHLTQVQNRAQMPTCLGVWKIDAQVNSVAFSPDGTRIVSGSDDRKVRIWNADSGEQVGDPLTGHDEEVRSVAFSSDGTRIVSGSDDTTVRIWDADCGEQVGDPLIGHEEWVTSVAFSPCSTRIVSRLNDSRVRTWDAQAVANTQLTHDGWLLDIPSGQKLIWMPVPMHHNYFHAKIMVIIAQAGYTKISLDGCHFGRDWEKCYIGTRS